MKIEGRNEASYKNIIVLVLNNDLIVLAPAAIPKVTPGMVQATIALKLSFPPKPLFEVRYSGGPKVALSYRRRHWESNSSSR